MAETISILHSEEEVAKRVEELGRMISEDYKGKQIHLICVLKGGVFFMCELAKRISVPVSMDFMSVSSYGDGTSSRLQRIWMSRWKAGMSLWWRILLIRAGRSPISLKSLQSAAQTV